MLRVWCACNRCRAAHRGVKLGFQSGIKESKGGIGIYKGKVEVGAKARVQQGVNEAEGYKDQPDQVQEPQVRSISACRASQRFGAVSRI